MEVALIYTYFIIFAYMYCIQELLFQTVHSCILVGSADCGGFLLLCVFGLGDSHTDSDRCVCAGYDNGDVKLFDLRTMSLRWETNVKNGVSWPRESPVISQQRWGINPAYLNMRLNFFESLKPHPSGLNGVQVL